MNAQELQKIAREDSELTRLLDQIDPDNKIPGEAIDIIIEWTVNNMRES